MSDTRKLMAVGSYRIKMPSWVYLALVELSALEGRDEGEILADLIRAAFRQKLASLEGQAGGKVDDGLLDRR